jgi:hypothetical protein
LKLKRKFRLKNPTQDAKDVKSLLEGPPVSPLSTGVTFEFFF